MNFFRFFFIEDGLHFSTYPGFQNGLANIENNSGATSITMLFFISIVSSSRRFPSFVEILGIIKKLYLNI